MTETLSHYRIIKKLGSGAMGEVYLADDTRLDRTVALKILPSEFVNSDRLGRFIQEAKAASTLDHPNIAHIYEVGEANGTRFIAMQYVEGSTLHEKVQGRPLAVNEIIEIGMQIADALDEAHSKGIVHRDIKPANVMINSRGQVKVLDFGLAKVVNTTAPTVETEPGLVLGTVQYMSPEQAQGKQVDFRSDIFSLGTLLYEMATGRVPFTAEHSLQTMQQIVASSPQPPSRYNYHLPPELDRIILKSLEKEADRRFQSARELVVDLKNLKRDSESGKTAPVKKLQWKNRLGSWSTLALIVAGIAAAIIALLPSRSQNIHSLAVLPFLNQSQDPEGEYLSDGLTDTTINRLSQLPRVKVLARGTVFTYKGKEVDPRKIGRELGVDAIVIGSIFQHGNELRVQTSLVNTRDGAQMWGEQYNRKMSDLLVVQSEISNEISESLRVKLTGQQKEQLKKPYTNNVEAYRFYLKGRYYLNKRTEGDFRKAIGSFQEAIARDPNYALAYAGLADCYTLLSNWGFIPALEGYPKAKAAAQKALSLDDRLAEAYTSLATITSAFDWNWTEAENYFRKALKLNPNYATAHHWYSFYLSQVGRHDEALREIRLAQQLDPLSLIIGANVGFTFYVARKYDQALNELNKTVELDPNFSIVYEYYCYVYEQKHQYGQSVASAEKALALSPQNMTYRADLARASAVAGDTGKAKEILARLLADTKAYVQPSDIASIYIGLGQNDDAIQWLEKAYQQRSDVLTYIKMDPRFNPLRSDPRFQDLLRRIHLA